MVINRPNKTPDGRKQVQNNTCTAVPVRKGTALQTVVYHPVSLANRRYKALHPTSLRSRRYLSDRVRVRTLLACALHGLCLCSSRYAALFLLLTTTNGFRRGSFVLSKLVQPYFSAQAASCSGMFTVRPVLSPYSVLSKGRTVAVKKARPKNIALYGLKTHKA